MIPEEKHEEGLTPFFRTRPTGLVMDEDPHYIQLELPDGSKQYARPCYAFPMMAAPSEDWLSEYADEIEVWCAYERGDDSQLIWMGFTPREDSATDTDAFPNDFALRTKFFMWKMNDEEKKWHMQYRSGGNMQHEIYMDDSKISIGNEDATEAAVLGDELKSQMDSILTELQTMNTNISATTVVGNLGIPVPIVNLAAFVTHATAFAAMKAKLTLFLSTLVKIK